MKKTILIIALLFMFSISYSATSFSDFVERFNIVSLASGDLIQWDGTDWVNVSAPSISVGTITGANDETIDNTTNGAWNFTASNLFLTGEATSLYLDYGSAGAEDHDVTIYFGDDGTNDAHYIRWNDGNGSYDVSAAINLTGSLYSSGDFRVLNGNYVGIEAAERIEFYTAGTIVATGADFLVGAATAIDTQDPSFIITGDADSDGTAFTTEALTVNLAANADPTLSRWTFISTQSAGYTFDKDVTGTTFTASTALTAAGNANYFLATNTVASGEFNAFQARGRATAVGASTAETRGVYARATTNANLYGGAVTALQTETIAKDASTTADLRGAFIAVDSEGTPTSIVDLFGVYIRTKTSVAPSADFYPLVIENETFGGGVAADAGILFKGTATGGFDYGIDMNGATMSTADWRLRNGALFNNSTADLLTITEANVAIAGAITQETYVIRKVVSQAGMTDATATNVFTITTTTTEFGGYKCSMSILAGDDMTTGNANTAVMGLDAHFVRVIENSGNTGTTSAVAEISQTASADEGTAAVTNITMTVVNTSETVQTIQANVDVSAGGVADIVIIVELIYWDLATAPVIAGS